MLFFASFHAVIFTTHALVVTCGSKEVGVGVIVPETCRKKWYPQFLRICIHENMKQGVCVLFHGSMVLGVPGSWSLVLGLWFLGF